MNKSCKIFIDCHVFDQSLQGTTSYIKGIYQELIKNKSNTYFFGSHSYDLKTIFGEHENVIYVKYVSKNKFYRLLIELPKLIKKHKIDYAHFQYVVPPIKRCKYIITVHDVLFMEYPQYFTFIYRISKRILYKASAKYSDIVLTVSEYSKKQIQKHFNIQNIEITPNAVDKNFFNTYNKTELILRAKEEFKIENYFLYISRWEPRKNHHLLLKVYIENEYYKKYNLVFIGKKAIENKEYNDFYAHLKEDIKSKIFCFENVAFNDLLLLVRAATIAVYPSIVEGFGIPPLESIAACIPTVCSNTTAMSDFDFIGDCLFNPFSEEDLNKKIKIALKDKTILLKKEHVLLSYDWKLGANKVQELILKNS